MPIDVESWLRNILSEGTPPTTKSPQNNKRKRQQTRPEDHQRPLPSPKSDMSTSSDQSSHRRKRARLDRDEVEDDNASNDDVHRTPRASRHRMHTSSRIQPQSRSDSNRDSFSTSGRSSPQKQFAKLELGDKKIQPGVLSAAKFPAALNRWLNQIRAYSSGRGILPPSSLVSRFTQRH